MLVVGTELRGSGSERKGKERKQMSMSYSTHSFIHSFQSFVRSFVSIVHSFAHPVARMLTMHTTGQPPPALRPRNEREVATFKDIFQVAENVWAFCVRYGRLYRPGWCPVGMFFYVYCLSVCPCAFGKFLCLVCLFFFSEVLYGKREKMEGETWGNDGDEFGLSIC